MYIGSTGERGLRQMVFEVARRAVGEVLVGHASCVEITLTPDGGVSVADDGPGPGNDGAEGDGLSGLEVLLTRMQTGARCGDRHAVVLGFNGVGPSFVNALSSRMTAEVRGGGARWGQEYARGVALTPFTEAGPSTGSGTTITFWPDADIFGTAEYSFDEVVERFRELALLNRDLEIHLEDRRSPGRSRTVRLRYPGGIRDFVAFLDEQEEAPVHPHIIGFEQERPEMAGAGGGSSAVARFGRGAGPELRQQPAHDWRHARARLPRRARRRGHRVRTATAVVDSDGTRP